jgi:hypothetical protein
VAASSRRIAPENAGKVDIFLLKYGIFSKILLQYGLDLFNYSYWGSVSSTSDLDLLL